MKLWKKPYRIRIAAALISVFIIVGGISCCTIIQRDLSFERRIQSFVDYAVPGSEIELFNGTNLGGWSVHGMGVWSLDKGVLSVQRGLGYLSTRCNTFTDFELSLDIRISQNGNSGVFFRSRDPGYFSRPWPVGYEAQIDNHDKKNMTGSIYNIHPAEKRFAKDEEWFSMKINATGSHLQVFVNGEAAAVIENATFTTGYIALQAHDPWSRVEFRDIRLRIPDTLPGEVP